MCDNISLFYVESIHNFVKFCPTPIYHVLGCPRIKVTAQSQLWSIILKSVLWARFTITHAVLRGSTDFLKTGTPYCTDQFCMDQRFKNILQKRNSVGSADIALTALLDHIITEQGSLLISKLEFFIRWYFQKLSFL